MIETIHQLLVAMKDKGITEIEHYLNIGHNPTIGAMYEGLTKQLIDKTIFKGLNLRVASGKIKNDAGIFSDQIDCMVVIGEGMKLPYINEYVYDINKVIAVIEVKKNLFSKELYDAYYNLKSVINIAYPNSDMRIDMLRDAFTAISKMQLPKYNEINGLETKYQMLYHSLVVECFLPIRVIFGYEGFANELSLRSKFIDFISSNITPDTGVARGFGATSLPNLIIAKENSLIKTNGMPYAITFDDMNEYCWIASYRRNPLLIFLELLWTRLTYFFQISSDIFGDSLVNEGLAPLLTACGSENGWEYKKIPYSIENISVLDNDIKWMPSVLSEGEFILLNKLCHEGHIAIDEKLIKCVNSLGEQIQDILIHLNKERLIYYNQNVVGLLTKECKCVIIPDLGYCAADDYDGRFSRWIADYMANRK